jgi:hypothetical protein
LVAPQSTASAQLLQSVVPLGGAISQMSPALPLFDAVMTKAMMGLAQGDPTAPAAPQDVATAPIASVPLPLPTMVLTPGSKLPLPDPTTAIAATTIIATTITAPVETPAVPMPMPTRTATTTVATTIPAEQTAPVPTPAASVLSVAVEPAVIATVLEAVPDAVAVKVQDGAKIDTVDRQRTGRLPRREAAADAWPPPPSAQAAIDPSVTLPITAAPVVTPQVDAFELPTKLPVAESHAPLAHAAPDPIDKRDAQAKQIAAEVKTAAPQPVLSDAPQAAILDASGVTALPPPVQAASPAAQALSTSPLPTPPLPMDAPQQAAPSGTPAVPVSPQAHAAPSPASQIAPVLVSMAHAPDGAQRLTLRLDPPDLGHVQIRIDRPQDAPARVDITVERAETLTLLLRDQPQLQRALDQAGVPPDGRSVTIHVAATESAARPDGGPAASQGMGSAGTGDATYGTPRQGGQQARHETSNPGEVEGEVAQIVLPGWMRGGLDITA